MVYTLVYRYFRICSNWTQFHAESIFLKGIFQKNGYTKKIIDKCFKMHRQKNIIKNLDWIYFSTYWFKK